jgi:hypothetical protein
LQKIKELLEDLHINPEELLPTLDHIGVVVAEVHFSGAPHRDGPLTSIGWLGRIYEKRAVRPQLMEESDIASLPIKLIDFGSVSLSSRSPSLLWARTLTITR